MTSVMALDGITSFLSLNDATYSGKPMRYSPTIGGISSVQWQKIERSLRLQMCLRRLLYGRIEIDKL